MAAGRYNLIIEQGSTYNLELQYKSSAGYALDLTGYHGCMHIRPEVGSSTIYLALSSSLQPDGTGLNFSGSTGTKDPSSGSIAIYISAATSSQLTFDEAVYDLEIYSGSYVARIIAGRVRLSKEITIC